MPKTPSVEIECIKPLKVKGVKFRVSKDMLKPLEGDD
jgi:hypothetical protein